MGPETGHWYSSKYQKIGWMDSKIVKPNYLTLRSCKMILFPKKVEYPFLEYPPATQCLQIKLILRYELSNRKSCDLLKLLYVWRMTLFILHECSSWSCVCFRVSEQLDSFTLNVAAETLHHKLQVCKRTVPHLTDLLYSETAMVTAKWFYSHIKQVKTCVNVR